MYLVCNKAWTLLGYLSFNDASFRFLRVPDSSSNKRSYVLGLKDFKLWATLAQNRLNSLMSLFKAVNSSISSTDCNSCLKRCQLLIRLWSNHFICFNRLSFPGQRTLISGTGKTSFIRLKTERTAARTPQSPFTTSTLNRCTS